MTRRLLVREQSSDFAFLEEAADVLRRGGLVAFPTETVYGVGVASSNPAAIERLARLKQRPPDKPFSYHLASHEQLPEVAGRIPERAHLLADRYWPGPLTLILPGRSAPEAEAGVRVPAGMLARR